jgi:hypothetical protein
MIRQATDQRREASRHRFDGLKILRQLPCQLELKRRKLYSPRRLALSFFLSRHPRLHVLHVSLVNVEASCEFHDNTLNGVEMSARLAMSNSV